MNESEGMRPGPVTSDHAPKNSPLQSKRRVSRIKSLARNSETARHSIIPVSPRPFRESWTCADCDQVHESLNGYPRLGAFVASNRNSLIVSCSTTCRRGCCYKYRTSSENSWRSLMPRTRALYWLVSPYSAGRWTTTCQAGWNRCCGISSIQLPISKRVKITVGITFNSLKRKKRGAMRKDLKSQPLN